MVGQDGHWNHVHPHSTSSPSLISATCPAVLVRSSQITTKLKVPISELALTTAGDSGGFSARIVTPICLLMAQTSN